MRVRIVLLGQDGRLRTEEEARELAEEALVVGARLPLVEGGTAEIIAISAPPAQLARQGIERLVTVVRIDT